jgi:hypothetical protein
MIGELVRTSLRRLLLTSDDPEFDNGCGADIFMRNSIDFFPEKPGWMLMGGRMKES